MLELTIVVNSYGCLVKRAREVMGNGKLLATIFWGFSVAYYFDHFRPHFLKQRLGVSFFQVMSLDCFPNDPPNQYCLGKIYIFK